MANPGMAQGLSKVNVGTEKVVILDDNWTTVTADNKLSAHFEHTISITPDGPLILTNPD